MGVIIPKNTPKDEWTKTSGGMPDQLWVKYECVWYMEVDVWYMEVDMQYMEVDVQYMEAGVQHFEICIILSIGYTSHRHPP